MCSWRAGVDDPEGGLLNEKFTVGERAHVDIVHTGSTDTRRDNFQNFKRCKSVTLLICDVLKRRLHITRLSPLYLFASACHS